MVFFTKLLKLVSRNIQLPYIVVNNRVKEKIFIWICHQVIKNTFCFMNYHIQCNYATIPYVVTNAINDKETLQKNLLETGILERCIQDSLDMIVDNDG